ncbi:MAG: hypothetical protein R3F19_23380 [Verrucomicrobiales bacterium]
MEEKIRFTIVPHDEDHVTLGSILLLSQFSDIDTTWPIAGNRNRRRDGPVADTCAPFTDGGLRMRDPLEWAEHRHQSTAIAAIITQAINIHDE